MRRCHLRGQENIWKRQLIHVGGFNLSLILLFLIEENEVLSVSRHGGVDEKLFLRCKRRNELIAATAASPLAYSPGTRSEYSDMGFILLGEILVRVARSEERRVGKECRSR